MIDHSGHPHPSTPKARALCRANGGTGSIAKVGTEVPKSTAQAKITPKSTRAPSLTASKVPVPKKAEVHHAPTGKKPVAKKKAPLTADKHKGVMQRSSSDEGQENALLSAPVGINGDEDRGFKDDAEKEAAEWYIAEGYGFVNSSLRGSSTGTDRAKDTIKQLDAIMSRSKLSEDIGVYRGVDNGRILFGDSMDGDLTGLEWREKGFSSTTVNEDVAGDFTDVDDDEGDSIPVKMRIVLPKGSSAFQASDIDDEAEMILARNSSFRVVADQGEDDSGVRVIDVELVL